MIKAFLAGEAFYSSGSQPDLYSAIQYTRWHTYGGMWSDMRFWTAGADNQGLLSLCGEALTLSGSFPDLEELVEFCSFASVKRARGSQQLIEPLARLLGWETAQKQIVSSAANATASDVAPVKLETPPLEEFYAVLTEVFGLPQSRFASWYRDTSHKIRHGLGQVLGVRENGTLAAVAEISHQNRRLALISSVATRPDFRGKGYAGALAASLGQIAKRSGRTAQIVCQDERAFFVYRKAGFVPDGQDWYALSDGQKEIFETEGEVIQ